MNLSAEQVVALAPGASAVAAGKKLAISRVWSRLGRNEKALWGECQGSTLYQVRVDLADLAGKCSCPSRRLPCKHTLGLLFLAAASGSDLPESASPDWVDDWLAKRAQPAERKEKHRARQESESAVGDAAAREKRAGRRAERVAAGLDALDLWMEDLVRSGLASVEAEGPKAWHTQAARLVDAQAPGLAARLRRMAEIPRASADWPRRLLCELGQVALLTHAFRRLEALPLGLQSDVRQLLGWTLDREDVVRDGTLLADRWLALGQRVDEEERLQVQRSWLRGERSGRWALILQFSAASAPFPESIIPGTAFEAELAFWPSASQLRALIHERRGAVERFAGPLPGHTQVGDFLAEVAQALSRQPWLDHFPCALAAATPVIAQDESWHVVDAECGSLPLRGSRHFKLLALSGGAPIGLAGEWDGETLAPLAAVAEGAFELLGEP